MKLKFKLFALKFFNLLIGWSGFLGLPKFSCRVKNFVSIFVFVEVKKFVFVIFRRNWVGLLNFFRLLLQRLELFLDGAGYFVGRL